MPDKTIKYAKFNAISGYSSFVLKALLTFFISPFLVATLGSVDFGIWKACQKFLDFATIADGRATQALKWVIANKESDNNFNEKRQAVGSALLVWLKFLPLLFVIIGTIVFFLPSLLNGLGEEKYSLVRSVGLILGINILLHPLLGIPDAVLVGINRGYRSTIIQSFWLVVSNIVMIVFAAIGFGLLPIASVVLMATIFNGLTILWIAKKGIPWFGINKPGKADFRNFFNFSIWILAWSLVAKLMLSSEILLLGFLVGPELVTKYTFMSYVLQLGLAISLLTGSSITPGLGKYIGAGEMEKAAKFIKNFRELIFFIAVVFASLILLFNHSFVFLWVGDSFFMGDTVNTLIAISFIQLVLIRKESQIQDLSLNIKKKVLIGFAGSLLCFFLAILFYNLLNDRIEGVFIGIIIGRLLLSVMFPVLVNKMASLKTKLTKKHLTGFFQIGICYWVGQKIIIDTWFGFFIVIGFIGGILLIFSYVCLLSQESKQIITHRIKANIDL